MCAAKKKRRLSKKEFLKQKSTSARSARSTHSPEKTGSLSFEDCIGWLACLIIIVAPLVFNARLRDFADLPQRTFVQAAVALVCGLALMRAAIMRIRFELPRDFCSCALAAFACWAVASVFWSNSFYSAFYASVHWSACAVAAVVLVVWMQSDEWLGRFAGAIIVSGMLVSAAALSQQFLGMTRIPVVKIPAAAFGNPNVLAEFLCCTIAFSAFAGWYARRKFMPAALCWFACAAGILLLYFIHCRSAWLAIGCLVVWSAGLYLKRRAGWKVFLLAAVLTVAVGGYTGYTFVANPALKRTIDASANYRLIVWSNTAELFQQKPVLGYGAGSFPFIYASVLNSNKADTRFDKDVQIRRAHNDFLQTAVELGLPGFLFLVCFFGGILVMTLRLMNVQCTDHEKFILFAASGSIITFLVNASFGFPFQRAVTPFFAFASAAMIIALYCRQRAAFFVLSRKGILITLALAVAISGVLLLRFNLGIIESDAYYKRALAMEKRHKNARALTYGLQALAARPGRMDVLTTVGRAYITTGRLDKGIDALQTVTEQQPYNLNALFILGVGYANSGRSIEALESFRRVLAIKPDFQEARSIVSRLKSRGRVKVNLT